MDALERRIDGLRSAVRQAVLAGDRTQARALRAELRRAEREWDDALDDLAEQVPPGPPAGQPPAATVPKQAGPLLPIREQVHNALTLLGAPATPKLVIAVHEAFFAGEIVGARLTSLRRDEERSFRAAPRLRPYYLCAALTADLLAPARGLLAVSTWPLARRIVGPLSARVDFLTAAIRVAEQVARNAGGERLLWRFAASIPGAAGGFADVTPEAVVRAARAELAVHSDADRSHREAAAERARTRLDDVTQLFGSRLRVVSRTGTES
ncbi:hypothetical protein ACNTMW_29230 [Planosporangium sp. 12N6]|uniref:hypothetical protein n=1 Tax=Planosporangium spinosum TaxID=3402278 RepID=UPI003CF8DCAF